MTQMKLILADCDGTIARKNEGTMARLGDGVMGTDLSVFTAFRRTRSAVICPISVYQRSIKFVNN